MACVVFFAVHFARNILFYGLAGGISISRVAAKYAVAILQKRFSRLVDGVDAVRLLAHYEPGVSELALRDSRVYRWDFLWMDVAQDRLDFCVGHRACIGRRDLALLVQNRVNGVRETKVCLGRLLCLELQVVGT